jgi:hypothetical protein
VKPPLDGRELLAALDLKSGYCWNEQRLAVREVLLLQLLEPWYFSLIFNLALALCLDLPTGWSTR